MSTKVLRTRTVDHISSHPIIELFKQSNHQPDNEFVSDSDCLFISTFYFRSIASRNAPGQNRSGAQTTQQRAFWKASWKPLGVSWAHLAFSPILYSRLLRPTWRPTPDHAAIIRTATPRYRESHIKPNLSTKRVTH